MPMLSVNVGNRPKAEFERVIRELKAYGFRYEKASNKWTRFAEQFLAEEIIQSLRLIGVRAKIS